MLYKKEGRRTIPATDAEILSAAQVIAINSLRRAGDTIASPRQAREMLTLQFAGLDHNAAAVVLCHNHPSGVAEPSRADEAITARLRDALALVDVRVVDHVIVAGNQMTSLAERGLI